MSNYLDIQYATQIVGSLLRGKIIRAGGHIVVNGRCPICGDSSTDATKARFRIYPSKKGDFYMAGCFNCNYNQRFSKFLKEYYPDEYRSYILESFKENGSSSPRRRVEQVAKPTAVMPTIPKLAFCERLDTLPADHPVVKYIKGRRFPEEKYNRLWFTREWQQLANSIKPEPVYRYPKPEPRLVIPIFNEKGDIESFQGRALRKTDEGAKYITIKACDDSTKVYGQDTINPVESVYLFEGPLDSLFIENAGAITGGQLALSDVPYKNTRVWVLDNEARHPDTTKRIRTLIDAGEKVVMWDRSPWPSKDVNEMIMEDGATREEIQEYLKENTVSGLMARLRFKEWNKSPNKK